MEVLQRTANRGSISTASAYEVNNSVSLTTAGVNSEFFNRTYSSASNRQTWTYSTWLKLSKNGVNNYFFDAWKNSNTFFILGVSDAGRLVFYDIVAGTDYGKQTDRLLRDTSAWYHVVFVSDTTNGTAADRFRVYINGVRETDFNTDYGDPPQNYNGSVNDAIQHRIGYRTDGSTSFNGYLAETILVDGTALDPDSFGEFDSKGIWRPIDVTELTVGTNGFLLKYENAAGMGVATSGTGFSVQNINQHDQATDVPSNNFCTFNPLLNNAGAANYLTQTRGNIYAFSESNAYKIAVGTMGVTSGKWYWEITMTTVGAIVFAGITYPSIWDTDYTLGGTIFVDDNNDPVRYNASGRSSFGSAFGNGDVIAFALDMDASTPTMTVYKNNSSLGNLMSGLSIGGTGTAYLPPKEEGYFPKVGSYGTTTFEANFGGSTNVYIDNPETDANGYGRFKYEPPSGYYALCTKNLAEFGG
jgi:hypothetical protein